MATFLQINTAEILTDLLNDLNEAGTEPVVSGLDRFATPFIAWLNEVGGDSAYPYAARLDGEDSAVQRAVEVAIEDLRFPVVAVAMDETDELTVVTAAAS